MTEGVKISTLHALAFGIITLAVLIAIGMTFLVAFGNTDASCADGTTASTAVNESGFLNASGYTLALSSTELDFANPSIVLIINASSNKTIGALNYTLTGNVLTNKTAVVYSTVKITYTYDWNDQHNWNSTAQTCQNLSSGDDEIGTGTIYTTTSNMSNYLGTSNGLASWIPLVIVMVIGLMFLGGFLKKPTS
jgi:hypothetical protein